MKLDQVLKLAGIAVVAIAVVLVVMPVSYLGELSCGPVVAPIERTGLREAGCDAAHDTRLTWSVIVGIVGVALFAGGFIAQSNRGG